MRARVVVALALALLWTSAAFAQQIQPVVYVAEVHVKLGKEGEFIDLVKKIDVPLFEKLMAEGAVFAWGVDIPLLHQPGGATHIFWWAMPDVGALDKVFAAFEENEKKMAEEDARTAEEARRKRQPAPKSSMERFFDIIDVAKHRDFLFRDVVIGGGAMPAPGTMPYGWLSTVRVLPGKGEDYRRLWEKYNKPVYDKLAAQGAIYAYALGVEEARSTDEFSHYTVVSLPNLAAREKVRAAFNADRQARSPEERSQITQSFLGVVDPSASRAFVLRAVIFHAAAPK
jgi:hypothetical protein